jgi:aromatic-L-amino-acid decarboxylase
MNLPDLPPREALHQVADLVADYLENIEDHAVFPDIVPGSVAERLASAAPEQPEPLAAVLQDVRDVVIPNMTHWNHPGFMAYIAISGSLPGILGEMVAAALNVNAMLWRTSPAATELEERVCDWVRQLLVLPPSFVGHINDTASIGVMLALAAARERAVPGVRQTGLQGQRLRIYTSDQAHSSVDKAAIALGLGLQSVCRLPADSEFRFDPQSLERALQQDRAQGVTPLAVLATAGTTSTGTLDKLQPIAELAERHGAWLHVDAAYGGGAAICPEIRAELEGLERADSVVINPHKWLFVPVDCSLLFLREPELLKRAFSLVPAYLATPERGVTNLMDYGPQLGRRFRSLKLWMVLRAFGADGLRARIREHLRLARLLASWIDADSRFERVAPVELGIVAFRAKGDDALQHQILDAVNRSGEVFLSHSVLRGQTVLRIVVGNIRTTERHVRRAWELVCQARERR